VGREDDGAVMAMTADERELLLKLAFHIKLENFGSSLADDLLVMIDRVKRDAKEVERKENEPREAQPEPPSKNIP